MSRPRTAPSRSGLERAQSNPVGRYEAQRSEQSLSNGVDLEEAMPEAAVCTPRRSAEIEEIQSSDEIQDLAPSHDEELDNDNSGF